MKVYDLDKFDLPPDKITVKEALRRLKEDPNDPDPQIQAFKKSMEDFYSNFAPKVIEVTLFSKAAIEAIQPTLQLSKVIADSIKPIPDFANSLRQLGNDMQSLAEPMRVLMNSIAKFEAPLIYPVLPKLEYPISQPVEEVAYEDITPTKTYQEELLEEQNFLIKQLIRLQTEAEKFTKRPFSFDEESNTFLIKTTSWRAMNLNVGYMGVFFKALLEILEEKGLEINGYIQVEVSFSDLLERLRLKGVSQASRVWVKSTKSNLVHKKIAPAMLQHIVIISEHDKGIDGFFFRIKLPEDSLKAS